MMLESGDSPDVLRQKVTSPNGTTAAAMQSLQDNRVFDDVVEAVTAAFRRSRELGHANGPPA